MDVTMAFFLIFFKYKKRNKIISIEIIIKGIHLSKKYDNEPSKNEKTKSKS